MVEASRITLSIAADPVDRRWRLTPVADGRVWLLAWRIDPWPVDAGVPERLASAMAEALCACGPVAHLASPLPDLRPVQGWRHGPDGAPWCRHAVRLPPGNRLFGRRQPLSLIATTDPTTAVAAFDTAGFDWCLQGQIIFLLPSGKLPPVDGTALAELMTGAPASARSLSRQTMLRGLMLPGVDGAVAQIVGFDPGLWPELESALYEAANRRNIDIRTATEAQLLLLHPDPTGS